MLGQLKELRKLRQLKKQMESIETSEEYEGVKITMNGAMEVLDVEIKNPNDPKLAKYVRKAFNRTIKSVQKGMMENMGGLSGMFGG